MPHRIAQRASAAPLCRHRHCRPRRAWLGASATGSGPTCCGVRWCVWHCQSAQFLAPVVSPSPPLHAHSQHPYPNATPTYSVSNVARLSDSATVQGSGTHWQTLRSHTTIHKLLKGIHLYYPVPKGSLLLTCPYSDRSSRVLSTRFMPDGSWSKYIDALKTPSCVELTRSASSSTCAVS